MNKSILIKIKKNIIIINIFIITIVALHYSLNRDKFDKLNVYLDYTFKNKLYVNSHQIINNITTKFFLNEIYFKKEFYNINDLNNLSPFKKINLYINENEEKLEFSFTIKDKKIFNRFRATEEDLAETNIKIINNFVDTLLDKFHERLIEILTVKINNLRKEVEQTKAFQELYKEKNNNSEISSGMEVKIFSLNNEILLLSDSLDLIKNGDKLITNHNYVKNFRKSYLKTDEYFLSVTIILFLANILIRNINRIF